MNKILLRSILVSVFIMFSSTVFAFEPGEWARNSGQKTDDALILTGDGYLYGIMVVTDGTNPITIDAYDNTSGSGTRIFPSWTVTTAADDRAQYLPLNIPIGVNTGIYIDITTAGAAKYNVFYREK